MLQSGPYWLNHLPPLLSGPLFGVLFWWLATALGDRILRTLRVPSSVLDVWERGLLAAAIGCGSLQYLPFALSEVGRLTPPFVAGGLAVLALALSFDLVRVARSAGRTIAGLRLRGRSPHLVAWGALLGVVLAMFLIRAVTIGDLGDDDGIHLGAPRRWLHLGTLGLLPTHVCTTATLGFDMLYLIGLATWSAIGAKMIGFGASLLALLGVFLCGRRLANETAGCIAVSSILIVTPVSNFPYVMGMAMLDPAACFMTVASVVAWLVWREHQQRGLLVCMALCAGLAASFKLTSLQVAMAWVPILIADARQRRYRWPEIAALLGGFGLLTIAPVLPWLYRSWHLTGNPLYPMFTSIFPTRDWTPQHAVVVGRYFKYYAWGVAAGARLSLQQRQGLLLLAELLVLGAGLVAWLRLRRSDLRALVAFAWLFITISIGLTGLIFRYWLPATMCLSTVLGAVMAERWARGRRRMWPALALMVVALASIVRAGFEPHRTAGFLGDLRMATGVSTFEREHAGDPLVQTWKYIATSTPADSRVLFAAFYTTFGVSSYAGFWADRESFVTDSHLQNYLRLDDWDAFVASVRKAGIDYVVVADKQGAPNRHGFTFVAGTNEYPFARRLVERYGQRTFKADVFEVYRLSPEALNGATN